MTDEEVINFFKIDTESLEQVIRRMIDKDMEAQRKIFQKRLDVEKQALEEFQSKIKEEKTMRKFEKISLDEYHKFQSFKDDTYYNDLQLPKRGSKYSAGYDISAPWDITLPAKSSTKIPTLLKVSMEDDEVVLIDVRSSLGFKHNVRLNNTIAVIDKDYYNNSDNEGHIFIKLYNPNDYDITFKKGERFAQAIFVKYLVTVDDDANAERTGGIGSTNK